MAGNLLKYLIDNPAQLGLLVITRAAGPGHAIAGLTTFRVLAGILHRAGRLAGEIRLARRGSAGTDLRAPIFTTD
jgi:hypothetical protein